MLNRRFLQGFVGLVALGILANHRAEADYLLVENLSSRSVLEYDGGTGAFVNTLIPSGAFGSIPIGPDGKIYAFTSALNPPVQRFDVNTGAFLGNFVAAGSGGLSNPQDMTFGPDSNLYTLQRSPGGPFTSSILQFNGTTGAFIKTLAMPATCCPEAFTFGPDGNIYLSDEINVERYNGTTGAFMGTFVAAGSGGLNGPNGARFGPNGNLYVDSFNTKQILEYDGTTGAFLGDIVNNAILLGFGPDGKLYASNNGDTDIERFDATTGAPLGVFVSPGSGGLDSANSIAFVHSTVPEPNSGLLLGSAVLLIWIWARQRRRSET
jgi:hypothetical protein